MGIKEYFKLTGLPVLFASLCCLTPLILVLFGLGSVSFAASLADTLYGSYKWIFRFIGLILLAISLIIYFRKKNICTLDDVKQHRNKVINTVLIALIAAVFGYIIWLYVIVHYAGAFLGIWGY